jgi:hypothetical protein
MMMMGLPPEASTVDRSDDDDEERPAKLESKEDVYFLYTPLGKTL